MHHISKFLLIVLAAYLAKESYAFSECRYSSLPDPNIPGVRNCLDWLAYAQTQGINLIDWCSNDENFQKCCLTCENYLAANECTDIANSNDCEKAEEAGLCDLVLFNTYKLSDLCQESCKKCTVKNQLTCSNIARNCTPGTCLHANTFGIQTVQCLCPYDRGGSYCQQTSICNSYNPCLNGGTCSPLYEDDSLYRCTCQFGFTGRNCQTNLLGCSTITCYNGGNCQIGTNGVPYCNCPLTYSGLRCQNYIGGCFSNPCQNGGTCSAQTNSGYYCFCPPNFTGKNCNYAITYETCLAGDRNSTLCSVWSMYRFCDFSYLYESTPVPLYCPVTCNLCQNFCTDQSSDCPVYSRLNLCGLVNAQNPDLCRRSCNTCRN